jgi:hypothetical protein
MGWMVSWMVSLRTTGWGDWAERGVMRKRRIRRIDMRGGFDGARGSVEKRFSPLRRLCRLRSK